MSNKKKLIILAIIILAALPFINKDKVATNTNETVKIGVILPLSGDFAEVGNDAKNGVLYAYEQRKDSLKNKYDFIFEDFKYESKLAALAFNKLASVDNVNAAISLWNMASLPIAPLAEKQNLAHISIDTNKAMLNYKNNIMHYSTATLLAKKWIEKMQTENLTNIVVLRHKLAWTDYYSMRFYEELKNSNIKILDDIQFNYSEKDYRTALNTTKSLNPDLYVMFLDNPGLEKATKQLREIGIKTRITAVECIDYTNHIELFEDVWYTAMAEPDYRKVEGYQEKYGIRFKPVSGYAYNAANILMDVFEAKGPNATTEEIIETINNMGTIDTVFGPSTVKDRIIPAPVTLKQVIDGKIVIIE